MRERMREKKRERERATQEMRLFREREGAREILIYLFVIVIWMKMMMKGVNEKKSLKPKED